MTWRKLWVIYGTEVSGRKQKLRVSSNHWLIVKQCELWVSVYDVQNIYIYLFLFSEWAREGVQERRWGRGRGKRRKKMPGRFHLERRALCGAGAHNPNITTWAKTNSQTFNKWATQNPLCIWFLGIMVRFLKLSTLLRGPESCPLGWTSLAPCT